MKTNFWLLALLPLCLFVRAQEPPQKPAPFWGRQEAYLADQTRHTLCLVDSMLRSDPPSAAAPSLVRRAALMLLDGVLHDTRLDGCEALAHFMERRLDAVEAGLARPLTEGLEIWKLYNDGFIVRSPRVTIAFDLYRGAPAAGAPALIADERMRALVGRCDALFLSHNHPDHVDPAVVGMFAAEGKPVFAPTAVLPADGRVTHLREEKIVERRLRVADAELRVKILPGHQSELDNNIYAVTMPEGHTVVHTGDQYHREDLAWLGSVGGQLPPVDVLIVNCWANDLPATVEGFAPRFVLTGHENELGHTIDHRESYWTSYLKLEEVRRPGCLMTWGECFRCR